MTDFAFVVPLVILFGMLRGAPMLLGDGDTGWHLRTGQWILENGRIPDVDTFSFTKAGEPWFAWEWLWDVCFGWLHLHWGMPAVIVGSLLILCLTSVLLFRLVRRKSDNDFVSLAITLVAVGGASIHWLARPMLVTPLFVILFYSILERARDGRLRLLAVLPFLTVLWTNLHGGFGAGFVMVAAYAAGELMAALLGPHKEDRRAALDRSKPYLLTLLCCLLASLVNPYGYRLHAHIYSYLLDPFYRQYVREFQSLDLQHPGALFFIVMIILGAVAAFQHLRKQQYVYLILYGGWCQLAITSVRHVPIFLIVTAPFAAATLCELLSALKEAPIAAWVRRAVTSFERQAVEFAETDRVARLHLASALAILIVAVILGAPSPPPNFRAGFDQKKFPVQAVKMLREKAPEVRVFSTDSWGGYLTYSLYPAGRVFIDGRSDFYGPEFCHIYMSLIEARHGWQKNLDDYGVDLVLLPTGAPLAGVMKESRQWRSVHDDGVAIVFRRTS